MADVTSSGMPMRVILSLKAARCSERDWEASSDGQQNKMCGTVSV